MDQNPLPRGSLQICDRTGEDSGAVLELPQPAVAVEAQYPAYPTGAMIVINVLGVGLAADGAPAGLLGQHPVELGLADAVAPPEVVLPRPAAFGDAGFAPGVVARLAIAAEPGTPSLTPREVGQQLYLATVRAVAMTVRYHKPGPDLAAGLVLDPLGVALL